MAIGSVVVWKARTATRVEISSAMQLAESVVADTIGLLKDAPTSTVLRSIDFHFQSVRHVRIVVQDGQGSLVEQPTNSAATTVAPSAIEAPAWFRVLIAPAVVTKAFPIFVASRQIGTVRLTSEPSDEISEVWVYAEALLVTAAALNAAVLGVLFLLFGRVLAPLTGLVAGLEDLERRNYAVRLPRPSLLELARITDHFNRTAEAISTFHDANRRLNRQLLIAQDDERRRTALELHDEVGPCLFALDANACSIAAMTKQLPDGLHIHERAVDIVALVERARGINRRVLDRLRPMALGQVPLHDCLLNLLVNLDGGDTGPSIDHDIGRLRASYGGVADLTIYRCAQEGLFNAIRHAGAKHIALSVQQIDDSVIIEIRDDGIGMRQPVRAGLGLTGMRERVEALSGSIEFAPTRRGTCLHIVLPIEAAEAVTDHVRRQVVPA